MHRAVFPLHDLPAWCALNDVKFRNVKIEEVEGRGYGLVADADLSPSGADAMLEIPHDLVLSAQAVEDYAKIDQNFRGLLEKAGRQVSSCSLPDLLKLCACACVCICVISN